MLTLPGAWSEVLADYTAGAAFGKLCDTVASERKLYQVFPLESDVFNALKSTDIRDVKAVILGQDPYHDDGQAHGLAFSVPDGIKLPPSLRNIYRELADEYCWESLPESGDLSAWARQGVLLLNTVLFPHHRNAY